MSTSKVDRDRIVKPQLDVQAQALSQLQMMWKFDPTVADKVFRFSIDGKGCDGFDYACGFDAPHDEDFLVEVEGTDGHFFAFDPFAARYMPFVHLDFKQDFEAETEGFVVTNMAQADFKGKFWRKDPTKELPLKE
ncbi:MAG: hypothetical protein CME71_00775 [Halobacteriovorax sp.]|nr:hypothetical protein [Halobacteriovorax sp.]